MILVKTNLINHFFIISEQDMKLERVITFLQNELSNLRDEIDGLKNVMLGKVDEMTSQLTASNAELAKMKGRVTFMNLKEVSRLVQFSCSS